MAPYSDLFGDTWYIRRAEQCERLARTATNDDARRRYLEEAQRWREIAASVAKD